MLGFKNSNLNKIFIKGVFAQVLDVLAKCSELMYEEHVSWNKKIPNHEEKIRNILLENYLENDNIRNDLELDKLHLRFIPEVVEDYNNENNVYKGRVDIKVVSENWFKEKYDYYIIECKRLDGRSDLNKKYVDNGIKRFVSEPILYSSYNGKNIMFGFIVKDIDIKENSQKINVLQRNKLNEKIKSDFKMISETERYCKYSGEYYLKSSELELVHLFFDFSTIISPS